MRAIVHLLMYSRILTRESRFNKHTMKSTLSSTAFTAALLLLLTSCGSPSGENQSHSVPLIGFVDFVEDATLKQARDGFFDALAEAGFSEDKKTLRVVYRNAQGDQPTLLQAVDYIISQQPVLIATNTTLATVNTVQRNKDIPVFMMVAPRPDLAGLTGKEGKNPPLLFGTYETLDYIDTSVTLIRQLFPEAKTAGTIYSPSEQQSLAALEKLKAGCKDAGIQLEAMPVYNSSETQLITQTLLSKGINVFFALPDNVIFSSFETVAKACASKNVPVLTSEAGLVARGALASFGADLYQWGHQAGRQAASYLSSRSTESLEPEQVAVRKKVINRKQAEFFKLSVDSSFSTFP